MAGSPHSEAIRWAERDSALIRLLTPEEANGSYAICGWADCPALPCFRVATPHGQSDYCHEHVDCLIASLPTEWLDGWAYREPLVVTAEDDDIPF